MCSLFYRSSRSMEFEVWSRIALLSKELSLCLTVIDCKYCNSRHIGVVIDYLQIVVDVVLLDEQSDEWEQFKMHLCNIVTDCKRLVYVWNSDYVCWKDVKWKLDQWEPLVNKIWAFLKFLTCGTDVWHYD